MAEFERTINGKKYTLRELTFEEGLNIGSDKSKTQKELAFALAKMSIVSPQLSEEELKKLPLSEGTKLLEAINEVNGFTADFLEAKKNVAN